MVDVEVVKFPKTQPIPGNEIRHDFLSFPGDRRWDLLGFVKGEEVKAIKSCEIGPDGHRYYLLQWKPSWKVESSLVYCEKLIQKFWLSKSAAQPSNLLPSNPALFTPNNSVDEVTQFLEKSSEKTLETTRQFQTGTSAFVILNPPSQTSPINQQNEAIKKTSTDSGSFEGFSIDTSLSKELCPSPTTNLASSISTLHLTSSTVKTSKSSLSSNSSNFLNNSSKLGLSSQDAQLTTLSRNANLYLSADQEVHLTTPSKHINFLSSADQDIELTTPSSHVNLPSFDASAENLESLIDIPVERKHGNSLEKHNSDSVEKHDNLKTMNKDKNANEKEFLFTIVEEGVDVDRDIALPEALKKSDSPVVTNKCSQLDNLLLVSDQPKISFGIRNDHLLTTNDVCSDKLLTSNALQTIQSQANSEKTQVNAVVRSKISEEDTTNNSSESEPRRQCVTSIVDDNRPSKRPCKKIKNTPENNKERLIQLDNLVQIPLLSTSAHPNNSLEKSSNSFECDVCNKRLSNKANFMKHVFAHNEKHTCTICSKVFKSTHFLKHHMDKHNTTYQYTCPICEKKFKFKNNMRGHIRKHGMEKKFQCDLCEKKFIGRYNLKEHMKVHSDNRPHQCPHNTCNKAYKDSGSLNKHLLTHQEMHIECKICNKRFSQKSQRDKHMQFHYSWPGDSFKRKTNTEYKCEYCDKVFKHYSNMNAHVHKKHKERKIKCDFCSKKFAYLYELREHMFVHDNGDSKFRCQFCDKTFQRSTTLKNHERTTHLGIKRFECEICNKKFGTKFNMKVHIDKVHLDCQGGVVKPRVHKLDSTFQKDASVDVPIPLSITEHLQPLQPSHSLWRNMNTGDIIRNNIYIPEFGYYPNSNARGYQFNNLQSSDFNSSPQTEI